MNSNLPYIHQIETAVPEFSYEQEHLREIMKDLVGETERDRKIIHQLYTRSGINTRHSVIDDFRKQDENRLFFNGQGATPGTKSRNAVYTREARKLFVKTARILVEQSHFDPDEITHLITVSCTGFYAPGPDFDIIRALGLSSSIERYHLGFMGCYAAIPALKMAKQYCQADPDATVLIVSAELCTLHFQANNQMDNLLSTSVFSDGAAGAIVSSRKPQTSSFKILGFASSVIEKGADDMAWTIGDTGFNMDLSTHIPDLIREGIGPFLNTMLGQYNLEASDISEWAVHPGGRAILDKLETSEEIPDHALDLSRNVLSRYGNMSSATILFVLKEMMQLSSGQKENLVAMAFGPGLTLESVLLERSSKGV